QPPVELLITNFPLNVFEVHSFPPAALPNSSSVTPSISTTLVRLVKPVTTRTRARGTPTSSARKRTHSSLALPSTGGAVKSSFHASPSRPVTAGRRARGCTFTVKRAIALAPSSWPPPPPPACPPRRRPRRHPASRG